jgi:N6-L-threonylcarbamoyladenine synthase
MYAYSQIAEHQKYHGVVPELAYRIHSEKIIDLVTTIGVQHISECDAIAVTTHPGLPGSLMVGITIAQTLSQNLNLPCIHVNHIDGHIASILIDRHLSDIPLPMVVLSASGGHTTLFYITSTQDDYPGHRLGPRRIRTLGTSLDDAAGECFDKVSTMLWWPYPWGPRISQQAHKWHPNDQIHYRSIMLDKTSLDFSFSGMKSQTHQLLQRLQKQGVRLDDKLICDIAYTFQETMVDILINKITRALDVTGAQSLAIVWWVSANTRLQLSLQWLIDRGITYLRPVQMSYCVDNAGMIATSALLQHLYSDRS